MPRAVRPVNARVRAVGAALSANHLAVGLAGAGLGAEQECCPQLGRGRAGRQHRRDAVSGAQPSGGDQRYRVVDLGFNQLKEGEKSEVTGMGVVEAAPVSTRLNTLHDEAVHAGLLGELGLFDRRDGDPDRGPGIVQSINLRRGWAAESRRDDRNVLRAQQVQLGLVGVVVPTREAEGDAAPVRLLTQTLGIGRHPCDAGTMTGWREEIDTVWCRLGQQ